MRRTHSRSPSSSSVRCGCQYFQSTDPLPERRSLVGTPPLHMADHEYEPISPMKEPPPELKITQYDKEPSGGRREHRIIKLPNTDQVIIPLHGDSDEEYNPDRYKGPDTGAPSRRQEEEEEEEEVDLGGGEEQEHEHEQEVEVEAPSTPTTVGSRTEGEVHTSQVESSALEQLPLQRSARTEPQPQPNLGKRIRNQAGRIGSRIRNISMPERPRFSMPERPKFLSERPKFNMPERPKFLTERPKFSMPEKPKFLTERPKFLTEKPKFLRERPKFKMPERPKFNVERPKLTMPKFDFMKKQSTGPRKKQTSSTRRPLKETASSVVSESSGSRKNIFEGFKYPTYPRFFKKKKDRRVRTPPPRMETESSLQSSPGSRREFKGWVERYRDIKFADDSPQGREPSEDEVHEENQAHFQEGYFSAIDGIEERKFTKAKAESTSSLVDSDKEQQSSGSSSAKRRAGVLEEIDSDEFFLREKGLSREDVEVSRYLSLEIRDAFRSPDNALARLDAEMYFDDEYEREPEEEEPPKAPERRRAPLERTQSKESGGGSGGGGSRTGPVFATFPHRPNRRKRSGPASLGGSRTSIEKPPRRFRPKASDRRQTSMPSLHTSEELQSRPEAPPRRRSTKDLSSSLLPRVPHQDSAQDEMEVQGSRDSPPVAPSRKARSRGTSLADEDRTSRGVESIPSEHQGDELPMEDDSDAEEARREEEDVAGPEEIAGYAVVAKPKSKPPRPPPPPTPQRRKKQLNAQLRNIKDQGINFFFTYPRRAIRSLHRAPVRPVRNYSTLGPSRPPRRNRVFREPVYVDGDDRGLDLGLPLPLSDSEKLDKEDEECRDLQSGMVVEKMKGRPLPPPPRPPRKSKEAEQEEAADLEPEIIERDALLQESVRSRRDDFFSVFSQIRPPPDLELTEREERRRRAVDVQQQTSFDVEFQTDSSTAVDATQQTSVSVTEMTVSVQTDPLPEDFLVEETEMGSIISESRDLETRDSETPSVEPEAEATFSLALSRERRSALEEAEAAELEESVPPPEFHSLKVSATSTRPESPPTPEPSRIVIGPVMPEKLHLSELEVDRLSVNEIQAKKIVVSDVEAQTMQISELSSKAGNLTLSGVELPPELLQTLADRLREATPQRMRVVTPPPPIIVSQVAETVSLPTPQVPQTRDLLPRPKTTRSKGRKSPTRVIDDSEDELASIIEKRDEDRSGKSPRDEAPEGTPPLEAPTRREEERAEARVEKKARASPLRGEPSSRRGLALVEGGGALREERPIPKRKETEERRRESDDAPPVLMLIRPRARDLLLQLLAIWQASLTDYMNGFVRGVNSVFPEDSDKRRDLQTAACILLVLIAGLIVLGFGSDNTVHHHHWDYVPPR